MKKVVWIITIFMMYGSVAVGFELDRAVYHCLDTQDSFCKSEVIPRVKALCEYDNNATACYITARFSRSHNKLAEKYFDKSCDFGNAFSCYMIGIKYDPLYHNPQYSINQPNLNKAISYYHKGCEIDEYGLGCSSLLDLCINRKLDCSKAVEQFSKSCDLGKGSCVFLGVLYQEGKGVKQDYAKARELYKKYCDLGNSKGCFNLGLLYDIGLGVRQDYKKANELYQKTCDLGDGRGCYNLGVLYNNGQGVKQNKSKAKDYCGKACDLGFRLGCIRYEELNKQGY